MPAAATAADVLPLSRTVAPVDQTELADVLRQAYETGTAVYPIGGGTSMEYGLTARQQGWGVSLAALNRVVDYPARDMTITVEAGISMAALSETLAAERQRLPIDAAQPDAATLGGVVATNFSGPRRFSRGTVRDYVIGISAVDGRGVPFKGGGRVVKNVAGYDFCKLLTGSLGTLGVISQITLKVVPIPEASRLLECAPVDFDHAERLLAALVASRTAPTAIELLAGPAWGKELTLLVGLEGTAAEVQWMAGQLHKEWAEQGIRDARSLSDQEEVAMWRRLTEFPSASGEDAAAGGFVLKAGVKPSAALRFMQEVWAVDPRASLLTHAGNGIVLVRCPVLKPAEIARTMIQRMQPAAAACGGNAIVLAAPEGSDLTRQAVWGTVGNDAGLMRAVKQQFDPSGLLNPGRFVYGAG